MRVVLISPGFERRFMRLQPHKTLLEMGRQLVARGHEVVLISDMGRDPEPPDELGGLPIRRLDSVNLFHWRRNPALVEAVDAEVPDIVLWHLGFNSFMHQELQHPFSRPTIGIITSPVYALRQILRLGITKLSSNAELFATHVLGAMVPGQMVRRAFTGEGLRGVVTLSETSRQYLIRKGASPDRVWTVAPGVDCNWLETLPQADDRERLLGELGFQAGDFVIAYFGSPAPVRGVNTMLAAVERASRHEGRLRLLMLSRRHADEWQKQAAILDRTIGRDGLRQRVRVVDGYLEQEQLIRYLLASDAICLPFEVVPSDVPLSILEAMALGKGVIGTDIACIPEMLGDGRGFLVPPASVSSLAGEFESMMRDPELIAERGKRARSYVQAERRWEDMGDRLEQVLEMNGNG